MGNPHGVIFTSDLSTDNVHTTGPELEHHAMWPDRANIEFARIDSPDHITMRVWERGSGETMACGTGACATAACPEASTKQKEQTLRKTYNACSLILLFFYGKPSFFFGVI